MRFLIQDDFWQLFPEARIGVVVARRLDNSEGERLDIAALLADVAASAAAGLGEDIAAHPAVAPWRQAYQAFGVKPSKYRSSIESLLRSARAGRIRSVNPLVDLYNAVSLRHWLPCGGEDLAALRGDIRLRRAIGGEHFVSLGAQEPEPPAPGEVIYRDDAGVICRCWNWREADRTKLTPATTDAFLCIEALPPSDEAHLRAACDDLAALAREKLAGRASVELLSRERPEIEI
ncbi:MAG TPA: phenylalanine--tRNA ligase beta subunit-related protein [Roseiflexaceae bacterium]|nr:phenylalanine--tRNA ligase beta subunit-related protein [Roseiflexaceae bacterium]